MGATQLAVKQPRSKNSLFAGISTGGLASPHKLEWTTKTLNRRTRRPTGSAP